MSFLTIFFFFFFIFFFFSKLLYFFLELYNINFFFFFFLFFFFSVFFSLIFFNFLGFLGVFISNFLPLICTWISLLLYFEDFLVNNYFCYYNFGKWIQIGSFYFLNFDFFFDIVSFSFLFLTLSIGLAVYIYSFSYFRYEPNVERLLVFLNFFMLSMVFLVSSSNFINLFLGWELIGLTSFFLINFWSCRINTLKSAFKAFSFNKLSDFFLLLGIFFIFSNCYSLDINAFLAQLNNKNQFLIFFIFKIHYLDIISILFIFCAGIKSAQIGAHLWLPDSMEAPVPASALIHSATLVSAGVFLIIRFYPLFELSLNILNFISFLGATTAFFGGLISMHQSDTKKILAFSTISHCGFLMLSASLGILEFTILYLYVHGFFKALTFMAIGNVNRFNKGCQDFKKMGIFYKYLPLEMFICSVGLFNLCGLPFSLGFFIKHMILVFFTYKTYYIYFIFINTVLGAVTGVFYCGRLFFFVFFDFKKSKKDVYFFKSGKFVYSKFYSFSTMAAHFSLIFLFFISYIISTFLLIFFFVSYQTLVTR